MSFERLAPEQHDTLDGVPEPSETPRLVGHREAASSIASAYASGRLPHALLLTGPLGIGKATLAFHVARHLLTHRDRRQAPEALAALGPDSALFRQVASGAHLAVLHLTRSYNEKTKKFAAALSVEEIRRVGRFLSMTSHDGSYRMVIVDPAEDMTISAANALLKRLEEPPERTLFMLVSHAPGRLLPTIRSRCQVVRLSPLGEAELTEVLAGIGMPLPGDAAARDDLLRRSAGSARRAILLSQFGGLDIMAAFDALMATPRLDVAGAHKLADVVAGRDQEIRFDLLNAHMLERLADAASDLARSGRNGLAARYSALSQDLRIAVDEADTYNLDRKQHALNMILRLHQNFRM